MSCFDEEAACDWFPSNNLTDYNSNPLVILKISVLSFNVMFALPTHCYIIWLIATGTGRGVAFELFNLNLSVCEIIFSLYSMIYLPRIIFPDLQTPASWFVLKFLTGDITTIRPLFQSLICVERYLAVVHPVIFLKYKPLRYRLICCAVAWLAGVGSCVIHAVVAYNMYIWTSFLQFIFFLSVQLFCLVAVLRALKQSGPGDRKREKEDNRMKRRAFYIIVVMTLTIVVIFGPFIISRLYYILTQGETFLLELLSLYCFVLCGFVPAFLYLHRTGKCMSCFKPFFGKKMGNGANCHV